jgi:hypothetical protein
MSSARRAIACVGLAALVGFAGCSRNASPPNEQPAAAPVAAPVQSPSTDADLPPLPVTEYPAARPMEIVRAVYTFAARHPEVLSHIPCFCGCESRGHRHNDDCFVASRDARGRTTAWEPHGIG